MAGCGEKSKTGPIEGTEHSEEERDGGEREGGERARTGRTRASVPKIARVNCHTLSLF